MLVEGDEQRESPPRWFEVLTEHEWIEPGETVSDDLLLDLGREPEVARLELTLIWTTSGDPHAKLDKKKDTEVFARQIIPPNLSMIDMVASDDVPKSE